MYGGCHNTDSCTNTSYYNDVQYAKINSDGTLSSNTCGSSVTWCTTSSFTTARYGFGTTIANGYLYIMGGTNGSASSLNDVQYAKFNSDGTLGGWTAAINGVMGGNQTGLAAAAYDGYLYVLGGYTSISTNHVQYALICTGSNSGVGGCSSTAGDVGTWAYTHNGSNDGTTFVDGFTTARLLHASFATNGYLYVLGGRDGGNNDFSDVQYALICTANNSGQGGCTGTVGTVGSWQSTASFATGRDGLTATASNGYLYITGGCTSRSGFFHACNNVASDTQYAKIMSNGGIASDSGCGSAWCTTASFTTARQGAGAAVYNGYLYLLGGAPSGGSQAIAYKDVQYAPLNNGGGGNTSAWNTNSTSLSTARYSPGSLASSGYLYVLGGNANGGGGLSTVEYAPISTGGVGTFTPTSSFNGSIDGNAAYAAYNGYIYKTGGGHNGSASNNDVQYAAICTGSNTTSAFAANCTT
ncbi:MAG: hypothetical protein ACREGB_01585, partial [Candidatus Saccharimonadales bacterium]